MENKEKLPEAMSIKLPDGSIAYAFSPKYLEDNRNAQKKLKNAILFCGSVGALALIFLLILVYYIASTDVVGHYIYTYKTLGC